MVWLEMKLEWRFYLFFFLFFFIFLIFWILFLFFWIFWECSSPSKSKWYPKRNLFFFFNLSWTGFTRNEARITFFFFFWFFVIFLWMLQPRLGRNDTQNDFLFFLFFSLSLPCLAGNKARIMFLIFWIFLLLFLNFFWNAPARVAKNGTQNEFFFFSFLACPYPVWLEMKPGLLLFFFLIFHYFFGNALARVWQKQYMGCNSFFFLLLSYGLS